MKTKSLPIKKLIIQSSHYMTGTALGTAMHFFTFPIYTRIFSVADYGLLSLITVAISTALVFSKMGMSNAAIRFYDECHTHGAKYTQGQYYSTFFLSACLSGTLVTIICGLTLLFFPGIFFELSHRNLLLLAILIIFVRTLSIIILSFIRGAQRTKTFNIIETATSFISSCAGICLAIFWIKGLFGLYTGQFIVFFILLLLLIGQLLRNHTIRLRSFSLELFKESLKFGLPLTMLEFFNSILSYGDRVLIKLMCSAEALGIYSVGYNLSTYTSHLIVVPLSFAFTPILMRTWAQDGPEAVKDFLTNSVRYISLLFFPVIAGFIAIDEQLISILASEKYIEATSIVSIAIIGIGFYSFSYIFNAGLIIYKKTKKILFHSIVAATLNIALNIVLIPRFSILGAAYATLVAYALFCLSIARSSFLFLPFNFPVKKVLVYFFCALFMLTTTSMIALHNLYANIVAKIAFGVIIYTILILVFDPEIRIKCKISFHRMLI